MEKLLLIGVIALFLIGPDRLPAYSAQLARLVRNLRDMASGAKVRMKDELGPDFDDMEWKKLDPRQYDPRRIIRDALKEDPLAPSADPDSPTHQRRTHHLEHEASWWPTPRHPSMGTCPSGVVTPG